MSREALEDWIPKRIRERPENLKEVDQERILRFLNVDSRKIKELKPVDVIMVLGTTTALQEKFNARVQTAVTLWSLGLAKRILCTGGSDDEFPTKLPQAVLLKNALVVAGVPKEVIDIEPTATNTRENLIKSRVILEERGAKSAIVVGSQSQGRRILYYAQKHLDGIPIQVVSADKDLTTNPEKPLEEMRKLIAYRHKKDL